MTDGASNVTYRAYVEKLGGTKADEYVGNEGDLFYDRTNGQLRVSNGVDPGGDILIDTYQLAQSGNDIIDLLNSFSGNVSPSTDGAYTLGTPDRKWKDLYVSNGSIYIGSTSIKEVGGEIQIGGNPVKILFTADDSNTATVKTTETLTVTGGAGISTSINNNTLTIYRSSGVWTISNTIVNSAVNTNYANTATLRFKLSSSQYPQFSSNTGANCDVVGSGTTIVGSSNTTPTLNAKKWDANVTTSWSNLGTDDLTNKGNKAEWVLTDRTNGRVYRVIYMLTNVSGGYKGVITAETLV